MIENLRSNEILWDRWKKKSIDHPGRDAIVHWVAGEQPYRWTFSDLISAAETFAVLLKKNGIKKDEVCAIIIRHNPNFYPIYLAISCIGAIPAVLAYPNPRLHPDKFRQGIEGMSQRSGLDWILTEHELEPVIKPLITKENSTIKGLHFPLEWDSSQPLQKEDLEEIQEVRTKIKSSDPFLLQHSSGTTGLQKPVLLSHKAVLDHVNNYGEVINLNQSDKVVSWLPLYHDLGLIGAFHLPLAFGIPAVQISTFEWIAVPALLPQVISMEKGTLTLLPNFAYNVMADKIHEDELEGISLGSLRMMISAGEPVRFESHEKFIKRFTKYGLKPNTLSVMYGSAETTLAITQTTPNKELETIVVDRQELAKGNVKLTDSNNNNGSVRICVTSGKPIIDCSLRIIDDKGKDIGEDKVGEILIKSVSLFDGYRNYPEKTAEVLKNGWYSSGDYGFAHNGFYYVIGRKKDVIIVAGNNIYPEDIEDEVSKVNNVIPGRVIAFGEFDNELGSEQISVAAETELTDKNELKKLKLEIIKAGMKIDLSIKKVYMVPPRWLIKSSAGKPSRKANMERIVNNPEEFILELK